MPPDLPATPTSPVSTDDMPGPYLTSFDPAHAERIAGWIRTDRELLYLAPGTTPPITAQKVLDWGLERHRRHLFWMNGAELPSGYAELNEMPSHADQFWIGHFIVDPSLRGRGVGARFAQALVARAFVELAATDVLLVVFPDNAGAIRCYERAGMVALGKEIKRFEATGREHVFLRMGIHRMRYLRLAAAGRLPSRPVRFVDMGGPLGPHGRDARATAWGS